MSGIFIWKTRHFNESENDIEKFEKELGLLFGLVHYISHYENKSDATTDIFFFIEDACVYRFEKFRYNFYNNHHLVLNNMFPRRLHKYTYEDETCL